MGYSLEQNTFIVMSYYRNGVLNEYGDWVYSVDACKDEYLVKYPVVIEEESLKTHIRRIVARFNDTGSVCKGKPTGRPEVSEDVVDDLRTRMEQSPKKSLSKLSLQSGVPYSTCQKVVKKKLHMHPYKISLVQELQPADFPRRVQYCHWFQANLDDNRILDLSFFSDEAWFHLSGYVNSQNFRIWSTENPHAFEETPLHAMKVGVWLAVSRRRFIGPIFFQDTINAARYREQILDVFVNQLLPEELESGYFQQDGATAHTTRENLRYLEEFYDDRIISLRANPEWPPRSPDLTPLDFSVFGWMKDSIYKNRIHTLEELMDKITRFCNENLNEEVLQDIFENKKRRVALCLRENGQHFQHLL
ncbi:hypothetical protein Zmor_021512 [Zophobas morio]|uniref:Transposable element Tc3 transposase n=2 Tax=Zophobas morio TaxID=2755281 RepID=A0AA38MB55_9CUCU|nr:hypothetical protein Zmor_021512 [Zophobas morio]